MEFEIYTVIYKRKDAYGMPNKESQEAKVKVFKESEYYKNHLVFEYFWAENLELWGCGKNAPTPVLAIHLLVQDMAHIVNIKKG